MRKKGFTLVEILIAMVILSSGIILLVNSWGGSFLKIRKTQVNTEIAALLERKMVEVDIKYRGKSLEAIPEEEGEDFGDQYPQYSWTLQSKEFDLPDLSTGLTARDGGANQSFIMLMQTLSKHLKKTIKEVKVTVIYKPESGKQIKSSITTFFVDYNKEVPMPGGG